MTRPVTPVKASVPAELPEPELQEQAATETALKKRRKTGPYKRKLVARVPFDPSKPECGKHRWQVIQHTPRIWQCPDCTRTFEGPR